MTEITLIILAYLIGSIPFGLVLSKIFLNIDIREIGSGNIGATNVLRTGSKFLAFTTLILDGLKGAIAVIIANKITEDHNLIYMIGFSSIIGHIFPIWLNFRGGKGVATSIAVIAVLDYRIAIAFVFAWILTFLISKISSLSAILGCFFMVIVSFLINGYQEIIVFSLISLLIIIKHSDNIKRLIKKEEKKISF